MNAFEIQMVAKDALQTGSLLFAPPITIKYEKGYWRDGQFHVEVTWYMPPSQATAMLTNIR